MNKLISSFLPIIFFTSLVNATDLKINSSAPTFKIKTQENSDFDLASRKGVWTVLYFFPKAETPGCTTQACAFRDNIDKIRKTGADVFGISVNSVSEQAAFHKNHKLNFTLLADENSEVTNLYGSKYPVLKMSKRWTFIIDPDLKIKKIDKDVDPALDAEKVAKSIIEFQKAK